MYSMRMLFNQLPIVLVEPDKFLGPSALLHAYRFVADSRDGDTQARLAR